MVTAPTAGELMTALCRRVGNGLSVPDRFLPCRLGLYCQRSNPSPHRVAISSRVADQSGTGIKGLLSLTIDRLEGFEFSGEFVHRGVAAFDDVVAPLAQNRNRTAVKALGCERLLDILPRLKRVGVLCASAGRRIRYGLTPAPQFGDAPPKYILSRIEVAVVYLTAFGTYPFAVVRR